MKYVNIVIDNKSEYTDTFYTYRSEDDDIAVGDKVEVDFANRKKAAAGYVFEIDVKVSINPKRIKSIKSIDKKRSLNLEMVDTALWMRRRYGVKYIDAVKSFTVGGKREKEDTAFKTCIDNSKNFELSVEQKNAVNEINTAVEAGVHSAFLIKGVTNSGKTEVYMQAVEKALSLGKTAVVLVPEIALIAQIKLTFSERFGEDNIAVLHSKLTTSKRLEQWLKIKERRANIVIGARTAVFAPICNIGIIIIDEEHESTYKSDHNPKYDTIDVAYKRTMYYKAALVMGSATPSIISYYRAVTGIYKLLEMKERIGISVMPDVEIVDMKDEARKGNLTAFSGKLIEEITLCLSKKEQVILFLNRRGYSTQIICKECGYKMVCDDCDITMTYHRKENRAVCHYCGKTKPVPEVCPECGSKYIKYEGTGTEKVEEQIKKLFPEAETDRFDLDSAKTKSEIDKVISKFVKGKTDILIGTQILAKGLDFHNVGLVGVVMADVSLNIPDYRSSERTYQLITQVSGRAGRSGNRSRVVIQTFEPGNDAIQTAAENDYIKFYINELEHRKIMNYPPYSDIISIYFNDKSVDTAMGYADDFRRNLISLKNAPENVQIFKPKVSFRNGAQDRKKVYFIIKSPKGARTGYIKAYMQYKDWMTKNKVSTFIEIDVNPYGIV